MTKTKKKALSGLRVNGRIVHNEKKVRELCAALGITAKRGSGAGEAPAPRQLLESVGAGNIGVFHIADDLEYAMVDDIRRIAQSERPALADLLERVALAISFAEKLNSQG